MYICNKAFRLYVTEQIKKHLNIRNYHSLINHRPMPEEEKVKEVSRIFLKTLDDFYKESDAIFNECDAILTNYKKGKDITDDLSAFKAKRPAIFALIDDIYHKEVDLEEKLDIAGTREELRGKIREFKDRFADLADEIDLFVLAELDFSR